MYFKLYLNNIRDVNEFSVRSLIHTLLAGCEILGLACFGSGRRVREP